MSTEEASPPKTSGGRARRRAPLAWTALALLLVGAGVLRQFGGLLEQGLGGVVMHRTPIAAPKITAHDANFVAWVVARNARTLTTRPWRLFQAEPCAPAENALALGEPAITLGLLGTVPWLLTHDPVRTFNLTLLVVAALGPLAMFLLVWDWTRQPAAGIVAALAFGYNAMRVGDPLHPYLWDHTWTLLALIFARRLFESSRWRDAFALAACIALQLGGSFYALLGSALVGLPVLVWLVSRHGPRGLPTGPLVLVGVLAVSCALLLFLPALGVLDAGDLHTREKQHFVLTGELRPGGLSFPGWPLLALALLGVLLPLRGNAGQPRWALLGGGLLVMWFSLGSGAAPLPDLYGLIARAVPGLEVVRFPSAVKYAVIMPLGVLAGLGVAALLQRVPERARAAAGVALALFTALALLRPGAAGFDPSDSYGFVNMRPSEKTLRVFEALRALGNDGPLFEAPPEGPRREGREVLLSAYHGRRTSACASSFKPLRKELDVLAMRLPREDAVRELAAAGFTTVLVHHPFQKGYSQRLREELERLEAPLLREVYSDDRATAYAIELP